MGNLSETQDILRGAGFQGTGNFWIPGTPDFLTDYTDGEGTESRLLSIVETAQDRSSLSEELIGQIRDWPTRYHLSPERSNLLRCLNFSTGARVLELGSGCGAVTRFLGENLSEVIAVEGSRRRAQITAARCSDLDTVNVIAANFHHLPQIPAFDIATLIGVLEYAPLFYPGSSNPFLDTLSLAHQSLNEDGVLILAIENKFGIKYLSGCGEDHLNKHFVGIEGYPDRNHVQTFGLDEMVALLQGAGFPHTEILLPFPDYKIPTAVINAHYTDPDEFDRLNLIDWCRQPYSDYGRERFHLFNDHLALANLAAGGLFSHFSNSFLILAGKSPFTESSSVRKPDWVARKLNVLRKPRYRTITTLTIRNQQPVIEKAGVDKGYSTEDVSRNVNHQVTPTTAFHQYTRSLSFKMLEALRQEDPRAMYRNWVNRWIGYLVNSPSAMVNNALQEEYLDCIPDNVLIDDQGSLFYIDNEWASHSLIDLDWVIFRGLYTFWQAHRDWVERAFYTAPYRFTDFLNWSIADTGLTISDERLVELGRMESSFQQSVISHSAGQIEEIIFRVYLPQQRHLTGLEKTIEDLRSAEKKNLDQIDRTNLARDVIKTQSKQVDTIINLLDPTRHSSEIPATQNLYDIVVPIYNAYDHLARCIDSILRNTSDRHPIYLLDDASSDPRVLPLLRDYESKHAHVHVLTADVNGGFVRNTNRGLFLSSNHVVILNSDTEVTPNWLDRMDRCLSSGQSIGIVSPLSNNATILSVPVMHENNRLPAGCTVEEWSRRITAVSQQVYPRIPTAVGFCMMITRQTLDLVGGFDEIYGLGYGEENDLCMKAWAKGIETVICDDAYVHHYGEASFSQVEQIGSRREQNRHILETRWPAYQRAVQSFCQINPLRQIQERVRSAEQSLHGDPRPEILHVIHNFDAPGGVEIHTRAMLDEISDRFRASLMHPAPLPDSYTDIQQKQVTDALRIMKVRRENSIPRHFCLEFMASLSTPALETTFARVLAGGRYPIVHFHHLGGWGTFALPAIAKRLGKQVVISLHDFFFMCPEFNLVTEDNRSCGRPYASATDPQCVDCLARKMVSMPGEATLDIPRYIRERETLSKAALDLADRIVVPSETVRSKLLAFHPELETDKVLVIPHGIRLSAEPLPVKKAAGRFKVAFIGNLTTRKGAIELLTAAQRLRKHPVEVHIFGSIQPDLQKYVRDSEVFVHGSYHPDQLPQLLKNTDLVVIPSIVEETFSLTLSEARALGLPVLASSLGALRERIHNGEDGFLVEPGRADLLADEILRLATSPDLLLAVRQRLRQQGHRSLRENAEDYASLYTDILSPAHGSLQLVNKLLAAHRKPANLVPTKKSPQEILSALLDADDLELAINNERQNFSQALVDLVAKSALSAKQEGQPELAEGLDALAEIIQEQIPGIPVIV